MALSDKIKKYRKLSGLSVAKIVEELRITEANYYNWEKGIYNPNSKNLQKLADLFKVKLQDFYSEDVPASEEPDQVKILIEALGRIGETNAYLLARVKELEDQLRSSKR
jgi:transcriptional regulator with XRE-family HTH domain